MGIRVSQEINASRDAVWSELSDLSSHPHWMKDAVSIRFLSERESGVGTRMEVPTRVGPFRTTDIMEVTDWNQPNSIGVHHEGLVSGKGRFELQGSSPTIVIWTETLRFPLWLGGRVTAALAAPVLRWIWRSNLRRLANAVELTVG